ncbi:hypothetical protein E2C01_055401 [Portunus trituberculatus]|uniref:Uncharacterized protein n=1 Tax=Portunus trituberculatus TaxID=210409 RepID=A0A5B7GML2_PORTR|nr:hypothetical protein [Portunus trituberculatus]
MAVLTPSQSFSVAIKEAKTRHSRSSHLLGILGHLTCAQNMVLTPGEAPEGVPTMAALDLALQWTPQVMLLRYFSPLSLLTYNQFYKVV